jgi:hypothetical protein
MAIVARRESGEAQDREAPRCPQCGAALRFSHIEYAGRGQEVAVRRCSSCGAVVRGEPRPRPASGGRSKRRPRAPLDEGPPANPVIDAEIARRLLNGE